MGVQVHRTSSPIIIKTRGGLPRQYRTLYVLRWWAPMQGSAPVAAALASASVAFKLRLCSLCARVTSLLLLLGRVSESSWNLGTALFVGVVMSGLSACCPCA